MNRTNYWQMMICMWLLCTLKLSAADTQQPRGITDILKMLTNKEMVDRHASIERRKKNLFEQTNCSGLKQYTDRLDHLVKLTLLLATVTMLDIFKCSVRVIEDDTDACVFENSEVICRANDGIFLQALVAQSIMQLKYSGQVSVCKDCTESNIMHDEMFQYQIRSMMPKSVAFMLKRIDLFKNEPVMFEKELLTVKQLVQATYLLRQYKYHLNDVAEFLSDKRQLRALKRNIHASNDGGRVFDAFIKRKPFIEQARTLVLHEHERIQKISNDAQSRADKAINQITRDGLTALLDGKYPVPFDMYFQPEFIYLLTKA